MPRMSQPTQCSAQKFTRLPGPSQRHRLQPLWPRPQPPAHSQVPGSWHPSPPALWWTPRPCHLHSAQHITAWPPTGLTTLTVHARWHFASCAPSKNEPKGPFFAVSAAEPAASFAPSLASLAAPFTSSSAAGAVLLLPADRCQHPQSVDSRSTHGSHGTPPNG